ncbi:hypothetical protein [Dactylosporangium sp. NPDC049140]|uniref:hypothetical protein n=1 Tax=Dactylosporangium sp. NPDC049140 TaxID=3155647 RepID=UPI0033F803D3
MRVRAARGSAQAVDRLVGHRPVGERAPIRPAGPDDATQPLGLGRGLGHAAVSDDGEQVRVAVVRYRFHREIHSVGREGDAGVMQGGAAAEHEQPARGVQSGQPAVAVGEQ